MKKGIGIWFAFCGLCSAPGFAETLSQLQLSYEDKAYLNNMTLTDGGCPAKEQTPTSGQLFRWVAAAPNPESTVASVRVAADLFPLRVCIEAWSNGTVAVKHQMVERKTVAVFDVTGADFVVVAIQGFTFSVLQDSGVEPAYLADGVAFPMRRAIVERQPWITQP